MGHRLEIAINTWGPIAPLQDELGWLIPAVFLSLKASGTDCPAVLRLAQLCQLDNSPQHGNCTLTSHKPQVGYN